MDSRLCPEIHQPPKTCPYVTRLQRGSTAFPSLQDAHIDPSRIRHVVSLPTLGSWKWVSVCVPPDLISIFHIFYGTSTLVGLVGKHHNYVSFPRAALGSRRLHSTCWPWVHLDGACRRRRCRNCWLWRCRDGAYRLWDRQLWFVGMTRMRLWVCRFGVLQYGGYMITRKC